ncbi:hypothetical protein BC830DRAFT_1168480 [Chytriomyces sp. MP71]|nr:hypothetical protein BC830DRAFT_1168480 [Chytriomyces sp. MP71]
MAEIRQRLTNSSLGSSSGSQTGTVSSVNRPFRGRPSTQKALNALIGTLLLLQLVPLLWLLLNPSQTLESEELPSLERLPSNSIDSIRVKCAGFGSTQLTVLQSDIQAQWAADPLTIFEYQFSNRAHEINWFGKTKVGGDVDSLDPRVFVVSVTYPNIYRYFRGLLQRRSKLELTLRLTNPLINFELDGCAGNFVWQGPHVTGDFNVSLEKGNVHLMTSLEAKRLNVWTGYGAIGTSNITVLESVSLKTGAGSVRATVGGYQTLTATTKAGSVDVYLKPGTNESFNIVEAPAGNLFLKMLGFWGKFVGKTMTGSSSFHGVEWPLESFNPPLGYVGKNRSATGFVSVKAGDWMSLWFDQYGE